MYHVHCRGLVICSRSRGRARGREGKAETAFGGETRERRGKTKLNKGSGLVLNA
jgi:hypothetical protein